MYECNKPKALETSLLVEAFYSNLSSRATEWQDSRELERIRIATESVKKLKKLKKNKVLKVKTDDAGGGDEMRTGSGIGSLPVSPSKSRERISSARALDSSLTGDIGTNDGEERHFLDINTSDAPPSAEEIEILESVAQITSSSDCVNPDVNTPAATDLKPTTASDLGLLAEIMYASLCFPDSYSLILS
jgi:hypothetical protein